MIMLLNFNLEYGRGIASDSNFSYMIFVTVLFVFIYFMWVLKACNYFLFVTDWLQPVISSNINVHTVLHTRFVDQDK